MCYKIDPAWVQAIASILMVYITSIYVKHTKAILEESSNTLVTIVNFKTPDMKEFLVEAKNYGPGHALGVKIIVGMESNEGNNKEKLIQSTGNEILIAGSQAVYEIKNHGYEMPEPTPVYVYYRSQAGKEFCHKWQRSIGVGNPSVSLVNELNKKEIKALLNKVSNDNELPFITTI